MLHFKKAYNDMAGISNGSREMYDVMDFFEKTISQAIYCGSEFKREDRNMWQKRVYYCDGRINDFFKVFLCGYTYGKTINE